MLLQIRTSVTAAPCFFVYCAILDGVTITDENANGGTNMKMAAGCLTEGLAAQP
ncbi:hypothetical protein SAMN03159341_12811 [Paenibacillus sp. 1_12]|nr:hypothetical protein SAMN03159341_12811 [Paenibacillus sp. 1_12]